MLNLHIFLFARANEPSNIINKIIFVAHKIMILFILRKGFVNASLCH
jgi:hypothetical protein